MRNERLLFSLLPLSLLLGAIGLVSAACGGSSSSGSAGDCYDYTGFVTTTPMVSFSADVLPIFRTSCGISSVCHGCDNMSDPSCTNSGYKPFLGTPMMNPAPTTAQIAAIFSAAVGQPASLQTSTSDTTMAMVGNPDMSIIKAGDPKNSFMMYKLDAPFLAMPTDSEVSCSTLTCASAGTCGQAMPSGVVALESTQRDTIRRWIAQGALNN